MTLLTAGLPIPLGVGWGRISIRNSQFAIVSPEGFTIELNTIVRDEGVRDPEPSDNVFPNKLFDVQISDIHQRYGFNPFSKVVSANE